MLKRRFGNTGWEVSVIGFGCIKFRNMAQDVVTDALNRALDLGINLVDTARGYGDSEEKVGRAISHRRDEFYVSTKTHAITKEDARRDIETSLRNLKTDCIDLYGLHNIGHPDDQVYPAMSGPGGALEALLEAKEQGRVRHLYVSCHRKHDLMKQAIESGHYSGIMLAYNALNDELVDESVMAFATDHDVGVFLMKPLGGGALVTPPEAGPSEQARGRPFTTAQDALRFVLANPHVASACVGMTNVKEVEENAAVGERFVEMTDEEKQALVAKADELCKDVCRNCGYCQPCPQDILIPVILRHLSYYERYGLKSWARGRYRMVEVKADQCADCGECEEKCPYNVPIRERLQLAHEVLTQG